VEVIKNVSCNDSFLSAIVKTKPPLELKVSSTPKNTRRPQMPEINIKISAPLGWVTINAPDKLNALTQDMWQQFPKSIKELEQNDEVRIIIVRGSGTKAFSAGADISQFEQLRNGQAATHYNQLNSNALDALQKCTKPTIAMVQGYCLGGGMLIALSADLRLASPTTSFSLPPAKLGLGFDVRWLSILLKTIPPHRLKEMIFTGDLYKAEQIKEFGGLNHIYNDEELEAKTIALANTIAKNAPLTIQSIKTAIDDLAKNDQHIDFKAHDAATTACYDSKDYAQGQQAFKERRPPIFQGQ